MNAYELAKQLEERHAPYEDDAANMLRQQADLIRNLQKSLGFKNSGYETINLTPQLKPLSYNDIMETWWKTMPNAKSCEGVFEFARAIEERHGIK